MTRGSSCDGEIRQSDDTINYQRSREGGEVDFAIDDGRGHELCIIAYGVAGAVLLAVPELGR